MISPLWRVDPQEIVNVFSSNIFSPMNEAPMRLRGRIIEWKDDRGFGFITPLRGGEQVFVHVKAFSNRHRRPVGNEFVSYEIGSDSEGRLRAEHVEFMGEDSTDAAEGWTIALAIALLFLLFLSVSIFIGRLHFVVLPVYVVFSAVAFIVYRSDKAAAQQNQWRTGEGTLFLLGVLGGWPGAFVAQQMFHHKTKKKSFQIKFWVTVLLNCIGLALLFLM
jgi:uncharacterized membrane protein YsdA (DUF1294 family)/cold shock CspA family protein